MPHTTDKTTAQKLAEVKRNISKNYEPSKDKPEWAIKLHKKMSKHFLDPNNLKS